MAEVNVYYDPMGNTLTVWFGDRSSEYLCEETGDEVILMKNQKGEVIGFEKLNYRISENTNLKISGSSVCVMQWRGVRRDETLI
ncbi:MAG: DUF2283 domain-containing protein [Microcystis sp. M162S2]|uniref:DUF2283 domain-containing protein n=1 Tax=Microcystis sp. M162S2 TaxID=2771154 RepID=UPI00258734FC|nr:DUF2283 domain-containing protein [Microcystis sp. M162S2]MCA2732344.1 DUF2283 domain-containing protein [Microcystis sp. M162S2]